MITLYNDSDRAYVFKVGERTISGKVEDVVVTLERKRSLEVSDEVGKKLLKEYGHEGLRDGVELLNLIPKSDDSALKAKIAQLEAENKALKQKTLNDKAEKLPVDKVNSQAVNVKGK